MLQMAARQHPLNHRKRLALICVCIRRCRLSTDARTLFQCMWLHRQEPELVLPVQDCLQSIRLLHQATGQRFTSTCIEEMRPMIIPCAL